jgi:hypothetical protein
VTVSELMALTIDVGIYKDLDSLLNVLSEVFDINVDDYARYILENVSFSKSKQSLDLVALSFSDLGLFNITPFEKICDAARELGFVPCPHEVGPCLRLCLLNQETNEWLVVASEPMGDSSGSPVLFTLSRDEKGLLLHVSHCWSGFHPDPHVRFVFVRPKN